MPLCCKYRNVEYFTFRSGDSGTRSHHLPFVCSYFGARLTLKSSAEWSHFSRVISLIWKRGQGLWPPEEGAAFICLQASVLKTWERFSDWKLWLSNQGWKFHPPIFWLALHPPFHLLQILPDKCLKLELWSLIIWIEQVVITLQSS